MSGLLKAFCFFGIFLAIKISGPRLFCAFILRNHDKKVICPVAFLGFPAIDHWIAKSADMAGGDPDLRVLNDGRIDADDLHRAAVRADGGRDDHILPPAVAQVVFQLDSQRAVIPESVDSAIDFRGCEDKTATFAEGNNVFHHQIIHSLLLCLWNASPVQGRSVTAAIMT